MDGSSIEFVDIINSTKIRNLAKKRKILKIKQNIKVNNHYSSMN